MARIRNFKPTFWSDKRVRSVSRDARLFWLGLWTYADDNGRVLIEPAVIKGQVFPSDDDVDVWALTVELTEGGLIGLYEAGSEIYALIPTFRAHQNISHPSKWSYPEPPDDLKASTQVILSECSVSTQGSSSRGRGSSSSKGLESHGLPAGRPRVAISKKSKPKAPKNSEAFERCMVVYPKRSGGNPRKAAEKAFNARLAAGDSADDLYLATVNYHKDADEKGKTGTQYVMRASTFYGPNEEWREFLEWLPLRRSGAPPGAVPASVSRRELEQGNPEAAKILADTTRRIRKEQAKVQGLPHQTGKWQRRKARAGQGLAHHTGKRLPVTDQPKPSNGKDVK